jgi:hypothetical protein
MSATSLAQVAAILTEPFVRTGIYASPEQALKHIILDYIERQIAWTKAKIQRYEQKYQQTFAEWTEPLSGQATIAEEDDWADCYWQEHVLPGQAQPMGNWRQIRRHLAHRGQCSPPRVDVRDRGVLIITLLSTIPRRPSQDTGPEAHRAPQGPPAS